MSAAAAPAIASEIPVYFQSSLTNASVPAAPEVLQELLHELRQPLSSIEAIAYYLEMTLPPELLQARQYMHRLQELVTQADSVLKDAVVTRKPVGSARAAGEA